MANMIERNLASLHIQPYFMLALSGEFTPPSDILARKHMVGKLLIATYQKGTQSDFRGDESDLLDRGGLLDPVRYQPSWAEHVESTLYMRSDSRARSIHIASGLALASETASLSVVTSLDGTHISITSATPGGESYTLPFRAEDNFTRDFVTDAVQDFFERSQTE